MEYEQDVARHYAQDALQRTILRALVAAGKDIGQLVPADLAPVDEFHIGGRQATVDFAAQLELKPEMKLLDIGSGLGGASRYFADEWDCRVAGIDLTKDYVEAAGMLAEYVGLGDKVSYQHGSALDLPHGAAHFDGAYMLHVGMNIEDKAKLFRGVRRVLKPGGFIGVYDVMREADGAMTFPLPWASSGETSFVEGAATYRQLLEAAGFTVHKTRSRRDFALDFFRQMQARAAASAQPPLLGLHILMGETASQKVANMVKLLEQGLLAPTEMIAQAV